MTDISDSVAFQRQAQTAPKRIVLAGGSGYLGMILARHFPGLGHHVSVLARTTFSAPWDVVAWDGERLGPWVRRLDGAEVVINLAGRTVDCRYHDQNRREILNSRVSSTKLVGNAIRELHVPPRLWLNASTATIYRHSLDRDMDEETGELGGQEEDVPETWRFSIEVASRWEEAFFAAETPETRKVALRSAMVMSPERAGVFDILSRLVRSGLGGKAGLGNQYVSWIHELDFRRVVDFLIDDAAISGVVNVSSPNPLPNSVFMASLRRAWGIRFGLPASEWMLEIGAIFLRTETELILKSRRVVPLRLTRRGFRFAFPCWPCAADDLVKKWRQQLLAKGES